MEMAQRAKLNITDTIATYGKRLFGFIRGKVKTKEEAEDVLQDVWVQFSNLTNIDELESVSGWLFKVARNRVTDTYRKKKSSSIEDFAFEDENGELNFRKIFAAPDADPTTKLMKEVFWEELMKGLDELPPNQREVFVLNEMEDLTLQEIADQTGENIKTIISRKGYAVKHLRSRLQNLYDELNQ